MPHPPERGRDVVGHLAQTQVAQLRSTLQAAQRGSDLVSEQPIGFENASLAGKRRRFLAFGLLTTQHIRAGADQRASEHQRQQQPEHDTARLRAAHDEPHQHQHQHAEPADQQANAQRTARGHAS